MTTLLENQNQCRTIRRSDAPMQYRLLSTGAAKLDTNRKLRRQRVEQQEEHVAEEGGRQGGRRG
ncbi:hypothetical protein EYF80_065269 [Liparis tanakae]|uniref:Uncharacterized protein n=1 Tax=Liparis tanakae TaxID=230148 RepID=A0A4Z2E746_9TELE|nr:hypothetical protein EYF80_065269 [Liparis tanakae]